MRSVFILLDLIAVVNRSYSNPDFAPGLKNDIVASNGRYEKGKRLIFIPLKVIF